MIDPIGSITKITAGVLRRIADAVEAVEAPEQAPVVHVHIETLIINDVEQVPAMREKVRGILGRRP